MGSLDELKEMLAKYAELEKESDSSLDKLKLSAENMNDLSVDFKVDYAGDFAPEIPETPKIDADVYRMAAKHTDMVYELLKPKKGKVIDYEKAWQEINEAEKILNEYAGKVRNVNGPFNYSSTYRYKSEILYKQNKDPELQFYYAFCEFAERIYSEIFNQNKLPFEVKNHMIKEYDSLNYHFYYQQKKLFEEGGFSMIQLNTQYCVEEENIIYEDGEEVDSETIYAYPKLEIIKDEFYQFCFLELKELAERADPSIDHKNIIESKGKYFVEQISNQI